MTTTRRTAALVSAAVLLLALGAPVFATCVCPTPTGASCCGASAPPTPAGCCGEDPAPADAGCADTMSNPPRVSIAAPECTLGSDAPDLTSTFVPKAFAAKTKADVDDVELQPVDPLSPQGRHATTRFVGESRWGPSPRVFLLNGSLRN